MTTASTEAKRKTGDSTKTAALNKYGDDMPVISGWKWAAKGQAKTRGTSTKGDNV